MEPRRGSRDQHPGLAAVGPMADCSVKPPKLCCKESTGQFAGDGDFGKGTLLPAFFTEENATVGGVVPGLAAPRLNLEF